MLQNEQSENKNQKIILQGGGGHAHVVLDCLLESGAKVAGIFDPSKDGDLMGVPFRGAYNADVEPMAKMIITIGDNAARKRIAEVSGHAFTNAIHGSAIISRFAKIGMGSMILHRAVIQAASVIGNHVIVNTGAQVDHDCVIGNYVHLAPGVVLCGAVQIGEGAFLGAGAIVLPGKKIGAWATVGSGSVVTRDIPDHAVAMGNPARVVKINQHA